MGEKMVRGEDIEKSLKNLLGEVEDLQSEVDKRTERISRDAYEIIDCLQAGKNVPKAEARREGQLLRKAEQVEKAIKRLASPGVNQVLILEDRGKVVIGDGWRFKLPATLRVLLLVLCLSGGTSNGRFVGFKKWSRIQDEMEDRLGRKINKHGVETNLSRLRGYLLENLEPLGGANPYLIQIKRGDGVRLRLLKDGEVKVQNGKV
ncbi:hypothetical protein AKJ51_00715 [candidate division MSBL1 archaeon SCGC-AAA382A20]|uniref:Uncharacterized protein n=1 Tax=candidate division MSBL1 archaeon SCGC-AAA382A20 TaxID=1698280 RepID=A0A133VMJ2_9EURY|nr:hypothetical protein AKJ51_00715 [candidate division MSBL1 archaeon SCGC-AAA382A20]